MWELQRHSGTPATETVSTFDQTSTPLLAIRLPPATRIASLSLSAECYVVSSVCEVVTCVRVRVLA